MATNLPKTMSLFFMFIILMFFEAPNLALAQDPQYSNCSASFSCGNISDIGFPFWGSGRPSYCGLPGFELNCTDQDAKITIRNLTYQILQIEEEPRTFTVARTDYIGDVCPSRFVNTTLDTAIVNFTSDTADIGLYYGCPMIPSQMFSYYGLTSQFSCNTNGADTVGYYVTRDLSQTGWANLTYTITRAFGPCENSVLVPAYQTNIRSLENNPTEDNLVATLDQGFGLEWTAYSSICEACTVSGGFCGYNETTTSFTCFCSDQPYNIPCASTSSSNSSGSSSNKTPMTVGLSIAGAAIAGVCLGSWFLLVYQRRKRRLAAKTLSIENPTPWDSSKNIPATATTTTTTTTLTNLSRSDPSYPSSKSEVGVGSTYFGVQVFRYSELEEATENFDRSKELGDGGFGAVYYGVLRDGRVVAVKRLYENNMRRAEQFMNEIEILAHLRHPNLVTLYGCTSRHSRELLLVYEYISNGTVADHLHGKQSSSGSLTWPIRLSIAKETAEALAYLHSSDVIHRDVKTNNILLDDKFRVKVADFGLSRLFPNHVTHVSTAPQGTPGYVDPEYYQCYQLTDKSDVYSFGVVLVELISSLEAVDTNRHRLDINLANMAITKIQNHQLKELVDSSLGFETDYSVRRAATSVAELAFRCLQQERDMRPTMEDVLRALEQIEKEYYGSEKAEVLEIGDDDISLLKHMPPDFSPDSLVQAPDKWAKENRSI